MSSFLSKKITRLSFILCMMVLFIHAPNFSVYNTVGEGSVLKRVQILFGSDISGIAVPLFFCLSGLLFFYSVKTIFDVLKKIKKRIFTLVVPYIIWNTFYTVTILLIFNLPFLESWLYEEAVGKVTVSKIVSGILFSRYCEPMWFLRSLIFFIVLTPLLFFIKKKRIIRYFFLFGLFFINIIYRFNLTYSIFGEILKIIYYLKGKYIDIYNICFFFLGVCLSDCDKFIKAGKTKKIYSIASLLLYLCLVISNFVFKGKYLQIIDLNLFPMMIFAWFAVDLVVTNKTYKIEKVTFMIYCAHYMVQRILKKMSVVILGDNMCSAVINYALMNVFVTLILIYYISIFLNKFCPKLFKVISGGRLY